MRRIAELRTILRRPARGLALLGLVLLAASPLCADALQVGKDYYELRRFTDALSSLKRAIQEDPSSWEAYYYTGKIYQESKQPDLALRFFASAWRAKPGIEKVGELLEESYLRKATQARGSDGAESAVSTLEEPLKQGFFSVAVANQLMAQYLEQGRLESLVTVGEEVLRRRANFTLFPRNGEGTKRTQFLLGRAYFESGRLEKALEHLEVATVHNEPGAQEFWKKTQAALAEKARPLVDEGERLYKEGRLREARTSFEKALELHRDNPFARKMVLKIDNLVKSRELESEAEQAVQEGRANDAINLLREAAILDPENTRLMARIKAIQDRAEELEQARRTREEADREAKRARREKFTALIMAARRLEEQQRYSEARDAFREALALHPDDPTVLGSLEQLTEKVEQDRRYQAAVAAFEARNWPDAIRDFRYLLDQNEKGFRQARRYLALAYLNINRVDEFERHAVASLDRNPEDVELLYTLADQIASFKDSNVRLKEALNKFRRIEEYQPGYKDAAARASSLYWEIYWPQYAAGVLLVLGYFVVYFFLKQRPKLMKRLYVKDLDRLASRQDWAAVSRMYPQMGHHDLSHREALQAHCHFSRAFFEERQLGKSIREAQNALRLAPKSKEMRVFLGRAYYANKTISPDVLEFYVDLLEVEPENRKLLEYVGNFCVEKKILSPTTLSIMRKLAQAEPENDQVRQLLLRGCLKDNDRSATALSLYRIERDRNPANVDVRAILAEEHLKRGEVEKAIQECEAILNINLNHPPTHQVMRDAYTKLDKLSDLATVYQTILEGDPHNTFIQRMLSRLTGEGGPPSSAVHVSATPIASEPGASGVREAASPEGPQPARGTMSCPKCGSEVAIGTYFCSCGAPL